MVARTAARRERARGHGRFPTPPFLEFLRLKIDVGIGGRHERAIPPSGVRSAYNGRGTAEQHSNEGKNTLRWTHLSRHAFRHSAVQLQLHTLAYDLASFLRTFAPPERVEHWSLTTLREKLVQIVARIVRHGRYIVFQLAEVTVPRALFVESSAGSDACGRDRRRSWEA
jgi:hypothetical protein